MYSEMHPLLADQLNGFEGHLNAQIHGGYESEQSPNPYLPVASVGYQQYPQPQYDITQPQASSSHHLHPNTSYPSYNQPMHESTHSYDYPVSYEGTSQYSNTAASQNQQWSAEPHYSVPEPISNEPLLAHRQHHHYEQVPAVDQNSLQDRWASLMHTAGSPMPFTR